MSISNKNVKTLNKALAQGKAKAKVVDTVKQGNGHNTVFVEVKGHGIIEVIGVASTPRDFAFVGNHLRQAVNRAVAAGETKVAI
jgi:hypothetical protein